VNGLDCEVGRKLTCSCPVPVGRPHSIGRHEVAVETLTNHSILTRAAREVGGAGSTHIHLIDIATGVRLAGVVFATTEDPMQTNIITTQDEEKKSVRQQGKQRTK
jgi:hypothetical protein